MNFCISTSSDGQLVLLKAASLKPKCVLVRLGSVPLPSAVKSMATLKHALSSAGSEQVMVYLVLSGTGQLARLNMSTLQLDLDFFIQLQGGKRICAVHALKKRRALLVGFEDGSVALWSPLGSGLTFLLTATVLVAGAAVDKMLLSVNCDESHLLVVSSFAASLKQSVKLVSLTNNTSQSLPVTFPSDVTSLQFSHFKQSLLACGHEDGSVSLVDIFAMKLFKSFPAVHLSSVSSVRFSPFNRYLMVSISLDKRYVLFDVEKQKVVRTVATSNPLNSLSVHPNGVLLAVTSLDGSLMVYDLATGGKQPSFTFNNQDSSSTLDNIDFLLLDKETAAKLEQSALKLSKSANSSASVKVKSEGDLRKSAVNLADQSVNYMDVFSPVASKTAAPTVGIGMLKKSSIDVMAKLQAAAKVSPPKEKITPAVAELVKSPATSPANIEPKKIIDTTSSDTLSLTDIENKENFVSENDTTTSGSSTPVPSQHVSPKKPIEKFDEIPKVNSDISSSMNVESSILNGQMEWAEKKLADLTDTIKEQLIERIENIQLQANNNQSSSNQPSYQNASSVSTDFSKTMISGIIDDCLSDFRQELKSDIQNMHLELLKQFELQNQMIRNMFVQSTQHLTQTLGALVAENAHPFMLQAPYVSDEIINTGSQKTGKRTVR